MAKPEVWIAALGLSVFGASAAHARSMTLTSADIKEGATIASEQVFNGFGCTGGNVSPALSWSGAPSGTKSLAVSIYDPDAPTGSGWWHWTLFNIPANVTGIKEGASLKPDQLPAGSVEGRTDFGKPGYGGACPPVGDKPHRYILTVFALKTAKIDLTSDASGALVGYYLNQNTIAKTSLTAKYGR